MANAKVPDAGGPVTQSPRRGFLGQAIAGVAGGSLLGCSLTSAAGARAAATRKGLHPDGAPAADVGYSPGIVAEGQKVIFVSGQGPRDLDADMETQFHQTFERLRLVLEAAGGSLGSIVMLRGYFVHLARDMPVYRKVRLEYLQKPYPASSLVGVTELAIPGLDFEVEATAVI